MKIILSCLLIIIWAYFGISTASASADKGRCSMSDYQYLSAVSEDLKTTVDTDFLRFQYLAEESLIYRAVTRRTYTKLRYRLDQKLPLTGGDLETLNLGMQAHLELREKIYGAVYSYNCWLEPEYSTIDPEIKMQGIMISLSAALMLYDNYLLAISIFEQDKKLRRYLNKKHQGYNIARDRLAAVTKQYNSIINRKRVREGIDFYLQEWAKLSNKFKNREDISYLHLLIEQSIAYNSTLKFSPSYVIGRKTQFLSGLTNDALDGFTKDGINLFSLLFGNSVGLVQSRKGYLYNSSEVVNDIQPVLRAGDILLEKTPFRLTDKLIPGYWGHVAIWVGSEQELKQLGIWNHPVVENFHDDIKVGFGIVEALREGVVLSSVPNFLNIDDLAVLRQDSISDEELAATIVRALRQVGKAYDFNFDIETNDRIVCSELIYVSYTGVNWSTQSTLGRFTISPTHIAEKVDESQQFDVVSLYLSGEKVKQNKRDKFLALLD